MRANACGSRYAISRAGAWSGVPLPGHHVGRDRPRRAAEAEQRDIRRERALHPPHCLVHRREHASVLGGGERVQLGGIVERFEARPFAGLECHVAAERMRHHQDVGEQDRGIEAEAADRLQRDLGGELRREAEIEEPAGALAQRAIFGQIAPGLAHEPDRRHGLRPAGQDFEDRFGFGTAHGISASGQGRAVIQAARRGREILSWRACPVRRHAGCSCRAAG